jgi:hypothetical protein
LFTINVGLSVTATLIERRPYTSTDLTLLLSPSDRFPFVHEIAERLYPFIGGRLFAPAVEEVHAPLRIEPHDEMHSVIATVSRKGIVRPSIDPQRLPQWQCFIGLKPRSFEVVAFLWRWALLIEGRPHHWAGFALTGL